MYIQADPDPDEMPVPSATEWERGGGGRNTAEIFAGAEEDGGGEVGDRDVEEEDGGPVDFAQVACIMCMCMRVHGLGHRLLATCHCLLEVCSVPRLLVVCTTSKQCLLVVHTTSKQCLLEVCSVPRLLVVCRCVHAAHQHTTSKRGTQHTTVVRSGIPRQ